jgi:zinc protease
MTVWGDFVTEEMVEKLANTLGTWPKGTPDIPPQPKVVYDYKYAVNFIDKPDVNQSNISLGHIGGLRNNPDYPALSVMNDILSWERMFKKIRTDEGLAYSVWGTYGASYRRPGVFRCTAQTKSESTVYAIELMLEEVRRITLEEVNDEELARAKDRYLNTYVFNFDSKAKIVNRLMIYAYNDYPMDFMETVKAGIAEVTKADVLRVAKKYLQPDKVQILVVGNKEAFDKPLSSLGEVNVIDITIPPATSKQ